MSRFEVYQISQIRLAPVKDMVLTGNIYVYCYYAQVIINNFTHVIKNMEFSSYIY